MSNQEVNDKLGFFNDPMQDASEGSDDELTGVPLPQEFMKNPSVIIRDSEHKADQAFFKTMVIRKGKNNEIEQVKKENEALVARIKDLESNLEEVNEKKTQLEIELVNTKYGDVELNINQIDRIVQMVQDNNSKLLDILNKFNCLDDIKSTTTYKRLMNPNLIKDYTPSRNSNKKLRLSGGILNSSNSSNSAFESLIINNNDNNSNDLLLFNNNNNNNNENSIPMPPSLSSLTESPPPLPKFPKPDPSLFEDNNSSIGGTIMNFRGQVYMNLTNHLDTVRCISFYENKEVCYILSSGDDCVVKLWKVENFRRGKDAGTPLLTYRGHQYPVYCNCFVNGIPYSADINGVIIRWRLPPSNHILTEEIPTRYHFPEKRIDDAHEDTIWKMKSNNYNNIFMTISSDKTVKIWESKDNSNSNNNENNNNNNLIELKNIYKFDTIVCCGDFFNDKDASDFIIGDIEGNIYCCNLKSGKINIKIKPKDLNDKFKRLYSLINVNEMTIGCYEDGAIRFFDWTCGEHVETDQINIGPTTDIIQCDSNTLCVCSHDRTVKTISLDDHKIVNTIPNHSFKGSESIHCLACIPEKNMILSGGSDGLLGLYV